MPSRDPARGVNPNLSSQFNSSPSNEFERWISSKGFHGWRYSNYSDSITCPHGHEIEWDGECPDGCESPMPYLSGMTSRRPKVGN